MNKQHPIPFDKVNITGGFWKDRIALNESVTLDSVRRRFEDTGRFSALSCEWKQGEPAFLLRFRCGEVDGSGGICARKKE